MAQSASSKRFGDFEADLRSGELRKAGVTFRFRHFCERAIENVFFIGCRQLLVELLCA